RAVGGSAAQPTAEEARKTVIDYLRRKQYSDATLPALGALNGELAQRLDGVKSLDEIAPDQRGAVRSDLYLIGESLTRLDKAKQLPATIDKGLLASYGKDV
ncbi:hypothetical protein NQU49_25435, partial [Escherichia coli]|uniref:hypothetical protein n=1 Tax=Escherichia coli TaxID=562 RepID=UPI0021184AE3|nr:hypothetical protein [Escherichia coli]